MDDAAGGAPPAITFLSSAYRTERHVRGMVESVLAQTRTDWELVVTDNGLSDEIAAIVGEYTHDPRVRLVRQPNARLVGGVRAAAAVATGAAVAVLNSDDRVMPDFVAHMVGVLDARPDADAVACDALLVREPGGVLLPRTFARSNPRLREDRPVGLDEVLAGFLPYYTAVVRTPVWQRIGGYRECGGIEDLVFWLDLLGQGGRLLLTGRALGVWRLEAESVSHDPSSKVAQEISRDGFLTEAATASGRPADLAALRVGHRSTVYERERVQSRALLRSGDLAGARAAARRAAAAGTRRTAWGMAVATALAPRATRAAYRLKRAADPVVERWSARVLGAGFARRHGVDLTTFG